MQTYTNSAPEIQVRLLGEFSITINGKETTNLKGRTKRVWMLIEYLLANRNKDLSLQNLIDMLWGDSECSDPLNALKNLVYRARTLLRELSGSDRAEFIKFDRGVYCWNNSYPCVVDTEEFVRFCKLGTDPSRSEENQIADLKQAIALYRGEFLPKSTYSSWVVSASAYYSTLYNESVLKVCSLLIDRKQADEVITICEAALNFAPLEESIHRVLLYAYIISGRRNQALNHYNKTVELFYRELGVDITGSMRPLYKQLINSINHIEIDLSVIKNDLREAAAVEGAYYCDYDVFKSIYRVQARTIPRTGQSIFVVLLTLTDLEGDIPDPEVTKSAVSRLKNAILSSLRKGDVVASYSATQFIVMLPLITFENAQMVTNRILQRFRFDYRKNNVLVTTRINPVDLPK